MLNIYVIENNIPKNNYIELNDDQFLIDLNKGIHHNYLGMIKKIVLTIDKTIVINETSAKNENNEVFDITKISAGAKTVINAFIHSDKIINTIECGNNALLAIFEFVKNGNIYLPFIPAFKKDIEIDGRIIINNKTLLVKNFSEIYKCVEDQSKWLS